MSVRLCTSPSENFLKDALHFWYVVTTPTHRLIESYQIWHDNLSLENVLGAELTDGVRRRYPSGCCWRNVIEYCSDVILVNSVA